MTIDNMSTNMILSYKELKIILSHLDFELTQEGKNSLIWSLQGEYIKYCVRTKTMIFEGIQGRFFILSNTVTFMEGLSEYSLLNNLKSLNIY